MFIPEVNLLFSYFIDCSATNTPKYITRLIKCWAYKQISTCHMIRPAFSMFQSLLSLIMSGMLADRHATPTGDNIPTSCNNNKQQTTRREIQTPYRLMLVETTEKV